MGPISIRNITKSFSAPDEAEAVIALDDVSCEINAGEFFCIIGPSGCGKSTLLHTIAGFSKPTLGAALRNGTPISGPGPDRTVIFQEYGLFPWMTVHQNVEFGLRAKGVGKAERKEIVDGFIDLVSLTRFAGRYPHEISGGMKQRVSIARALAPDPDVVLMDEPFAALDSLTRDLLQEEILRIWERTGKTFVLITHNIEEAVFLGDRVLVMTARPGRVKAVVDVDLPRPRDPSIRAHDLRFLEIKNELSHLLRAEVVRAAAA
ncbi:MAG TPA: ABC transporter ATP-binding protein [Xanthobacteraceae bacterium]|uniref:ABC transporter ATP-binding protein n=1 Tax=Roseixanthobacter finlandensis TaxID=3119922 RepID=UPI000BD92F32|nr:MAG: ABC transporter ATP-binding protein [Rhizobiales bacterium 12-66-7]HQS07431.1 ABC transporter ATP-binding protein [Xanthobacteraceae bacterium]HQS46711.1 ABC transporter ATP-binding protein [Xanthobacteraceae bacterium]